MTQVQGEEEVGEGKEEDEEEVDEDEEEEQEEEDGGQWGLGHVYTAPTKGLDGDEGDVDASDNIREGWKLPVLPEAVTDIWGTNNSNNNNNNSSNNNNGNGNNSNSNSNNNNSNSSSNNKSISEKINNNNSSTSNHNKSISEKSTTSSMLSMVSIRLEDEEGSLPIGTALPTDATTVSEAQVSQSAI